jgi:hypothetical protein
MMKLATFLLLAIALSSHAFAVLRPRHPIKPRAPFRGEAGAMEGDSIGSPAATAPNTASK